MVTTYKNFSAVEYTGLLKRVSQEAARLEKIFDDQDYLLGKQSYPQLYYGWARELENTYAIPNSKATIHKFLQDFAAEREINNKKPEEQRDVVLVNFGRLSMQGTNDLNSMVDRANILTKYFLLKNPDIEVKDKSRLFTDDERFVIWTLGGKRCAQCGVDLPSFKEMEADHITA